MFKNITKKNVAKPLDAIVTQYDANLSRAFHLFFILSSDDL